MQLFEIKDYQISVTPEALSIKVLKKLVDRDRTKDKRKAHNELSFIAFMEDPKSPYADILDREERKEEILKDLSVDIKIDKVVEEAMEYYTERIHTVSSRLLKEAHSAVNKVSKFLQEAEINDRNLKNITQSIREIPALIQALKTVEKEMLKEQEAVKGVRGSKDKNTFEDGI